jgi:hypothetical protein
LVGNQGFLRSSGESRDASGAQWGGWGFLGVQSHPSNSEEQSRAGRGEWGRWRMLGEQDCPQSSGMQGGAAGSKLRIAGRPKLPQDLRDRCQAEQLVVSGAGRGCWEAKATQKLREGRQSN